MNNNLCNFQKWFKEPLNSLYSNPDAGFIILMISLPLLERYLREKSNAYESYKLPDKYYSELINIFPDLNNLEMARKFWRVYRHGLLHQATLQVKKPSTILSVTVHNEAKEIEYGYSAQGDIICVSPIKVSKKIISLIESDFQTFEGMNSPNNPLDDIDSDTGRSGYHQKRNNQQL
ncbi:MAG: hypothetical protein ABSC53_09710 [Bacteroidota bacterium]